MKEPVFNGSTSECLADFFSRHPWRRVQAFTAQATGVEKGAVRYWYNGKLPVGRPLLAVRTVLDLAGYRVEGFSNLPRPIRQFSQAIALDLISVQEAQELLEYADLKGVYSILLRGKSFSRPRQHRLQGWVDREGKRIDAVAAELKERLQALPLNPNYRPPQRQSEPEPEVSVRTAPDEMEGLVSVHENSHLAEGLAHALLSADALSKALLESPDQACLMQVLHELIGDRDIQSIADRLRGVLTANPTAKD